MGKTIRFSELVTRAGKPHVVTLWTAPAADPEFAKAIKQNRVLTVSQQPTGNRKDVAWIGFKEEPNVSYFVFPRRLPESDGKVVGIKYDLVEQPEVTDPIPAMHRKKIKPKPKARVTQHQQEKAEHSYIVVFKRTAVWESTVAVSAENKADARRKAEAIVAEQNLPFSEAVIHHDIRAVEESS